MLIWFLFCINLYTACSFRSFNNFLFGFSNTYSVPHSCDDLLYLFTLQRYQRCWTFPFSAITKTQFTSCILTPYPNHLIAIQSYTMCFRATKACNRRCNTSQLCLLIIDDLNQALCCQCKTNPKSSLN